jgi:hypothetical protein
MWRAKKSSIDAISFRRDSMRVPYMEATQNTGRGSIEFNECNLSTSNVRYH